MLSEEGNRISYDPHGPEVVLASAFDGATRLFLDAAERAVASERREKELQQRLTAADERADTATSLIQRIVANFDTEIEFHEDVEPNELEHDQVLTEMREFLSPKDTEWRMHPCKNGHRDVGAAGGVAHCYTCDEKITAGNTQEAFEQWNATHPAT
nr:hypothetical protein [Pseudomonas kitaguniensis]